MIDRQSNSFVWSCQQNLTADNSKLYLLDLSQFFARCKWINLLIWYHLPPVVLILVAVVPHHPLHVILVLVAGAPCHPPPCWANLSCCSFSLSLSNLSNIWRLPIKQLAVYFAYSFWLSLYVPPRWHSSLSALWEIVLSRLVVVVVLSAVGIMDYFVVVLAQLSCMKHQ